jgi:plastocyanin
MRAALALALVGLLLPAAASAHDGYVDIANHAFTPAELTVSAGVLVLWRWDGPDLNHTVTGDFFESDPGKAPLQVNHKEGDNFPVLFEKAGTYAYHCRVHDNMSGTIVVEPPPEVDRRPPKLTAVSVRVRGERAVLAFTVDEPVSVIAEVRRPGAPKVLRDSFRFVRAGERRTSVKLAGLGRGRFAIRLEAQDDGGNFARPALVSVHR